MSEFTKKPTHTGFSTQRNSYVPLRFNPFTAEHGEGVVLQIDQKLHKIKILKNFLFLFISSTMMYKTRI